MEELSEQGSYSTYLAQGHKTYHLQKSYRFPIKELDRAGKKNHLVGGMSLRIFPRDMLCLERCSLLLYLGIQMNALA